MTHLDRSPIDLELARRQWHAYVDALAAAGWEPVEVPPADDCPDAVFIEDTVVMIGATAVMTRPGADARRGEVAGAATTLESLGYSVRYLDGPGTLDGGDVLKVGTTVYVGLTGRTDAAGIERLAEAVRPLGSSVVAIPTTKVLHLKSAVTALPDGTVIGFPPLVDDPSLFPAFMAVPEEGGAHVVLVGGNQLLMSAGAPRSAELLSTMGYEPILVDISEYEKLEGCVTCLSVRLRVPPDFKR